MPDETATNDDATQQLLRILVQLTARQAFDADTVRQIIGDGPQLKAFNLCDGTRTQAEVARAAKLDRGNFSRTLTRWVAEGVVFRLGSGRDARLVHVFPVRATPGGRRATAR